MSNFTFNKVSKEIEAELKTLLVNCASKNKDVAEHARQTVADIYSASLSRVLAPRQNARLIYGDPVIVGPDDPREVPIDTYFNIGEGAFKIWSNGWAGGLSYNELSGEDEYRIRPFNLSSAIAWDLKYAEKAVLPVVQKGIQRLYAELGVKTDWLAFTPLMQALGSARTGGRAHVIPSINKAAGSGHRFVIDDVNNLKVLMARLNQSWANGGTVGGDAELSDLFLSPEMMGNVRQMAYNPQNTYGIPDSAESTALGLPDDIRSSIFQSGGTASIWDINLHQMKELGVGQPFTQLFYSYYNPAGANPAAPPFVPSTDEVIIGVARNLDAFAHFIESDDRNATFRLEVDDQHFRRARKFGYFGEIWQDFVVGNNRAVVGLVV